VNQKDTIRRRMLNRNKYRYQGTNNYPPLLVNKTIHQNSETLEHELTCYMIDCITLRGGDVRIILPLIITDIKEFCDKIKPHFKKWCFKGSERDIICQAVRDDRRIDRICLDSGEEIEVETNHNIKKEGATTYYI